MFKLEETNLDAQLCYIDGFACFTTCPLEKQWGDDWNDAPYEGNAGDPYRWRPEMKMPEYRLFKVAYEAQWETPGQRYCRNSGVSVQDINRHHIPWLTPDKWIANKEFLKPIFAGETLGNFCKMILESGGEIYLPVRMQK